MNNAIQKKELYETREEIEKLNKKLALIEREVEKLKDKIGPIRKNKRVKGEKGYGFNHNDLLDTAAIVMTGEQFEKFESIMKITNRCCVSHRTFYRYLPEILKSSQQLFEEEQEKLVKIIENRYREKTLGSLLISIDAAWNKRGHTSELGNFAAVLISPHVELNNKVLWQSTRTFSHKKLINGEDVVVHEGTIF